MRSDKTDFILKTQRGKTMASTHVSRPTNLEGSFKGHTSKSTHSVSDNVKSPVGFPRFIFELINKLRGFPQLLGFSFVLLHALLTLSSFNSHNGSCRLC